MGLDVYGISKSGSHIIRCSEAYTSKQCGACGELNDKLGGGSKTFNCQKCGTVADRDVHAARNILLRCLQICNYILGFRFPSSDSQFQICNNYEQFVELK
jgi:hypothetical protein